MTFFFFINHTVVFEHLLLCDALHGQKYVDNQTLYQGCKLIYLSFYKLYSFSAGQERLFC